MSQVFVLLVWVNAGLMPGLPTMHFTFEADCVKAAEVVIDGAKRAREGYIGNPSYTFACVPSVERPGPR